MRKLAALLLLALAVRYLRQIRDQLKSLNIWALYLAGRLVKPSQPSPEPPSPAHSSPAKTEENRENQRKQG